MPDRTPPSALNEIDVIVEMLGSRPAVFLDFDGTLAPIVDDPDEATIPVETRRVIEMLAELVPVGVISGRSLEDVKSRVAIGGLIYSGSHGFEIETADGRQLGRTDLSGLTSELERVVVLLERGCRDLPGVFIEQKPFSVGLHTRRAASDLIRQAAGDLARDVVSRFDSLTLHQGKEIFELRPDLNWNKGSAVDKLVEFLPGRPIPLYVGDDATDEDGYQAAESHGGVGIIVAEGSVATSASYQLESTYQVGEFLKELTLRFAAAGHKMV